MPKSSPHAEPSPAEAFRTLQALAGAAQDGVPSELTTATERGAGEGPSRIAPFFSDLQYRHLVEQIPAVVFTAKLDGGLYDIYVGPQIEALLGYSQDEWVRNPVLWFERLHPDDRSVLNDEFARGCMVGGSMRAECRFFARDGNVVWVHGEARLVRDQDGAPLFLQGVAFDITEAKRAEEAVRSSLREKETLLKEIHHRVKNNLQVTISLLRLQAGHVEDEASVAALREAQSRIRSIALVHELLYRSQDLSHIDLGEYFRDLTRQLARSYRNYAHVRVEVDVSHDRLGIEFAVPCGLIVTELVTNALKHAFPDDREGRIFVGFRTTEAAHELWVNDDGVGLPPDLDVDAGTTLGVQLVRTLIEQLGGRLETRSDGGAEFRVVIPRSESGAA